MREQSACAKHQPLDRRCQGAVHMSTVSAGRLTPPSPSAQAEFPQCARIASTSSEGEMHLYRISPFRFPSEKLTLIAMHCLVKNIVLLHRAHTFTLNT